MKEIFERVNRFHAQFLEELQDVYTKCSCIYQIHAWYDRLDQLTNALQKGNSTYRQIEDHIFELKLINLLRNSFPECEIVYEPKGKNPNGKNCDLEVIYKGRRYLVEIKSFHPDWKKAEIPNQHIAENNFVAMDGESYHSYQAVRGHIIDVAFQTEEKLSNYEGDFVSVLAVPDGFHLRIEDFRDFVFIYRNNKPRPDDPLGKMTMYNLKKRFDGTIKQFWSIPIPQDTFQIHPDRKPFIVAPLKVDDQVLQLQTNSPHSTE